MWSPIRSAIKQVINKIGRPRSGCPICKSRVWLQTELIDTKPCYQLVKTMTKLKEETRLLLYVFIKKKKKKKEKKKAVLMSLVDLLNSGTGSHVDSFGLHDLSFLHRS